MMRWLLWQIQDLRVYVPEPIRRWWAFWKLDHINNSSGR